MGVNSQLSIIKKAWGISEVPYFLVCGCIYLYESLVCQDFETEEEKGMRSLPLLTFRAKISLIQNCYAETSFQHCSLLASV